MLFLVKERHPNIDLFGINLASLRGNNVVDPEDGSVVAPASQSGDGEEGNLDVVEDVEETFDVEAMTVEPAKDPPTSEVNALPPSEES